MSTLEIAYANGQLAALQRFKLAWPAPTHPSVRNSAVNTGGPAQAPNIGVQEAKTRLTPQALSRQFDDVEQNETRIQPLRKLSSIPSPWSLAGAGALAGGVSGALLDDEHPMRSGLIGAASGATLGGLAGGLNRRAANQRLTQEITDRWRRHFDVQGQQRAWDVLKGRKLGADNICTSCRKEKHYGNCKRPIAIKRSDFNMGMTGDDPSAGDNPSTSPHYSSATTSVSALARAQEGRPADEQAATTFARLHRINEMADQATQSTSGLDKVSTFIRTKLRENRGPTTSPYQERAPTPVPVPIGDGDDGTARAWRSFDNVVDSTCVDGGAGTPTGEPAA